MRQVERPSLLPLPSGGALHLPPAAESPALLFLHGVGGGAWSWRPQIAAFAQERSCYVWEARGHGAAARVADAGLADYYTDAREALDAVAQRTHGDVTLVGHSMGGLLALALAAQLPQRVNGLVLVEPVYPEGDRPSGHDLGVFTPLGLALMRPLAASFARDGRLARTLARWMFEHSFRNRERMEAAWADQRRQIPIEYPKMFFEAFGRPEGFPALAFAQFVAVPVLLFNSHSQSLVATLRDRLGNRFETERIDGGHYLHLDRPVEVNERLARFLRERIDT